MAPPATQTPTTTALRLFVSYSRRDIALVEQIVFGLQACGFESYFDKHDISPGEAWKERLAELIRSADAVLFMISPDSVKSPIWAWELEEAARQNKHILPIVCRETDEKEMPNPLRRFNYLQFSSERFGEALLALKRGLSYDTDWIIQHRIYAERAWQWNKAGRDAKLLLSPSEKAAATSWLSRQPDYLAGPTDLQREYIASGEHLVSKNEASRKIKKSWLAWWN